VSRAHPESDPLDVMARRLHRFVATHRLAGSMVLSPGDAPAFVPVGCAFEVVADPIQDLFDIWTASASPMPLQLGLTPSETLALIADAGNARSN